MSKVLKFVSPLPPSVNHYLGKRVAFQSGRPYVQVYETKEAKDYKKHMSKVLKRAVEESNWLKTDELTYVVCKLKVYIPQKRRDSDNLQKCLFDSITESDLIIYDDSMIIPQVVDVLIDRENPRIEVEMVKSDKVGIFKNEDELLKFKKLNCDMCVRAKRNCSILRKSLENRVTFEVLGLYCFRKQVKNE